MNVMFKRVRLKFLFQDISEEPRIRFGIKDPSISFFKIIGFTFSAYHALKAKYRSGQFRIAPDEMTSTQLRLNWSIFAEVLAAEAGEARVFHRAFSMPKFISFLCTGRLATNSLHDSDQTWTRRAESSDVENSHHCTATWASWSYEERNVEMTEREFSRDASEAYSPVRCRSTSSDKQLVQP